jgi:phosphoglycolate phosphatase
LGGNPSDAEFDAAYSFFIRYYRAHSLEHTDLYPGIRDALEELRNPDTVLAVLTNKPVKISYDILAGLNLADYFFRVYGGDSFPSKKPDPVGIETLVREANVERESAIMIGDSSVDIATAKNAGVRSVGVSWGFKPESLNDPPADVIIHERRQLVESLRAARH